MTGRDTEKTGPNTGLLLIKDNFWSLGNYWSNCRSSVVKWTALIVGIDSEKLSELWRPAVAVVITCSCWSCCRIPISPSTANENCWKKVKMIQWASCYINLKKNIYPSFILHDDLLHGHGTIFPFFQPDLNSSPNVPLPIWFIQSCLLNFAQVLNSSPKRAAFLDSDLDLWHPLVMLISRL